MYGTKIMCSLLLGGVVLAGGCEKEAETPTGTPTPVPQANETTSDGVQVQAEDAAERTQTAAEKTGDAAAEQVGKATDLLKRKSDAAADSVASGSAAIDAQKQLDQVTVYIRENKWELAETTMKTLEANQASLPAAMQSRVTQARTMLDTARKSAATTNPAAAK